MHDQVDQDEEVLVHVEGQVLQLVHRHRAHLALCETPAALRLRPYWCIRATAVHSCFWDCRRPFHIFSSLNNLCTVRANAYVDARQGVFVGCEQVPVVGAVGRKVVSHMMVGAQGLLDTPEFVFD